MHNSSLGSDAPQLRVDLGDFSHVVIHGVVKRGEADVLGALGRIAEGLVIQA